MLPSHCRPSLHRVHRSLCLLCQLRVEFVVERTAHPDPPRTFVGGPARNQAIHGAARDLQMAASLEWNAILSHDCTDFHWKQAAACRLALRAHQAALIRERAEASHQHIPGYTLSEDLDTKHISHEFLSVL